MIDVNMAMLDPTSVFKAPQDVVTCKELTREQKIKILLRWEYDARELQVAEEENMTSPRPDPDTLYQVLQALHALGVTPNLEDRPPTKQGGEE